MSHPPPYGPYPPPYYGPPPGPPGHYPPPGEHPPPHYPPQRHPAAFYVPGAVMMPYPMYPPGPEPSAQPQPTYVTNYIYHTPQESAPPAAVEEEPKVAGVNNDGTEWVAATNTTCRYLEGRAVVAGHEGWDGSPLWVIRACHNQDLVPGKLSIRHSAAYVPHAGKEVAVQNIEVLCAPPHLVSWVPSGNGRVPPNAIPGGRTASGEILYIGRARYQLSLTPGKVHPSHQSCYISFGGNEVAHKMYDVLCRVG